MENKKYVAYVGTYTHGSSKGIQVYDVDVENGTLTERSEVEVRNSSHTALSKTGFFFIPLKTKESLYSDVMQTVTLKESTVWTLTE